MGTNNIGNKVLVISNLYPSSQVPFYGSFVKNFVDDLIAYNGRENTYYCVLRGRSYDVFSKLYRYLGFYIKIFYYLVSHDYDYVYVHLITHASIPIRIISWFKKLNLVFNIHGEDLLVQSKLAALFLEITKPMLYKAKLIVVPSYYFKSKTMKLLPLLNENKIFVSASSGVKESFYHSPIAKNRNNVIGYVSRIDRGKGWDILLKAVRILSDRNVYPTVKIIGGGADVDKLLKLVDELGLNNVDYIGPVQHDQLPDYYMQFDLFVFPTKLEESLGLVGIEAMASGVPVVASRIGGIQDYLIDNINGFYFETDNEYDLAEKIVSVLEKDDNEYFEMCNNAYEKSLEYKSSMVNKNLFDYLFQIK